MKNLSDLTQNVNYTVPSEEQTLAEGANYLKSLGNNGNISKLSQNIGIQKNVETTPISASQLNKSGIAETASSAGTSLDHKVKLEAIDANPPTYIGHQSRLAFMASDISYKIVEFDNMPRVTKSIGVTYEPIDPPHLPAPFQKYKKTDAVTYTIEAVLTSRTSEEAFRNYVFCLNLESWSKPFFGRHQMNADGSRGKLGAPPPVLKLTGYRGLLDVPVVLTHVDIPKPNDCDWIDTGFNSIPFPTVLQISVSLTETYSADQINAFDLSIYRLGGVSTIPSADTLKQNSIPTTSGIRDPSSIGPKNVENPPNDQYPGDLKPWEFGRPEFK